MGKILNKLRSGKLLVSDGAWGTFLQQKGLKAGECPEIWNLTHPLEVLDIARSYIEAGSDMIETNSFGGSKFKLEHYGLGTRVTEINKAAAALSRQAAGDDKLVLGSVGPTGKILMMGEVTAEEMYEAFKEQCMALESGGADAIVVETMSDLDEAALAVRAARENTACDVICTMTFEKTVDGEYRTMMGISPSNMVTAMKEAGAQIIGSNCGNGTEGMISILKEIRSVDRDIPVLIQGNAGIPAYKDGQTVFNESPEETAGFVPALIQEGASIIGGCCGTTPRHIMLIAKAIHNS